MSRTILITGANGNLGAAVVKKFISEQYHVIAIDAANTNLAFAEGNPQYNFMSVNLTDEKATSEFIQGIITTHKKIDGALLLVGGYSSGGIKTTDGNALKKMYSLNFETAYYPARPLFQHMSENGYGRIVFGGARPALKAEHGKEMIAYALSKSLLFKLAEFLNEEAKGKNLVVSVIVPSTIDTPANRQSMPNADPKNWVRAEQIAEILEVICSDKGSPLRESILKLYNNA